MIAEKFTCRSCGAFYAPGYIVEEEGVCLHCGKKRIKPNSSLSNGELVDEIRLLLLDSMDNLFGGLFASEIRLGLQDRGMNASTQRITNLIRYRCKHIKIQNIAVGTKWLNLYYTSPPLDLEENATRAKSLDRDGPKKDRSPRSMTKMSELVEKGFQTNGNQREHPRFLVEKEEVEDQ